MLRNRSRAVTNKQALMADHTSLLSPTKNPTSPISSFLASPRFFNNFLAKNISDSESPTSILDTKNSSSFVNPFGYERNLSKPQTPSQETNHLATSPSEAAAEAIGLALIDSIIEEKEVERNDGNFSKPVNRMALFGSKLKVQIPAATNHPPSSISPAESPKSPADFGIKTRNSLQVLSPFSGTPACRDFSRQLSLKEMELSEDYTCVITHGPNPKTTHIFDDCIVECCCGDDDGAKFSDQNTAECCLQKPDVSITSSSPDFLGFCHTCKHILGHDKDVCIDRGEKAFCSHEYRCQEMLSERNENLDAL